MHMHIRISLLALLATGCASSYEKVRDTMSNTPDWYEARKTEVIGEGYPKIGTIPTLTDEQRRSGQLKGTRSAVERAEALFRLDPRSVPAGLELAEMMQWAEAVRAELAERDKPGDFLSDEEARQLRNLFASPRAKG